MQHHRNRRGFTLLEVTIAIVLLTLGISVYSSTLLASMQLERANRESARARRAAEAVLESMAARPFGEIFAAFNASKADDGALTVPALGPGFDAQELTPVPGDADGRTGEVRFPTVLVAGFEELREDVVDVGLGMPRDLNGDGPQDALDHSADYVLLPVCIRVEWASAGGRRQFELNTLLANR
jgi:prepilin-type N-terminal cleavage/methylation domain-containing protein